ncbi:S-adenosylmethionine decarboxylase proenzyme [Colletotrichum tofieldiae]|uniref:S-adenosylmethionine decarboxylase proenzyme n=1 Tax=Colletotrichum tofieldiae TaxID=708197 RepID=A0A161YN28_9PEZI|nr:S-adenosylmethionine decarboxylase proenzyme [Colletotrichum tofieldiae]GKT84087.1 S-adenosylmethionine decarboxylase proenzyme [Colletotrichum tofieldiae]
MASPPKGKGDDTVSVVESLETKSSMSGSDVSTKSPPKPLPILLIVVMFLMIVASGGGLCLSALQFRPSKTGERDCLSQSFILFASMISPMYVALHIIVSFRNYQVVKRQSLQSPLVSWAVIVARLGLLLWIPATILSSVAMSRYPGFVTQSPITELNLAVSAVGITTNIVIVLVLEIATHPFELPCFHRRNTITCLVSAFEKDLKEEEAKPPSRASSRPPTPPAYYYFPANHRHTIPAPARAKLVRKASYPRRSEHIPPVPAIPYPYPHPDSLGIMLPIPEPLPPLPELATTPTPMPTIKVTPATAPACLCPGNGKLVPPAPNKDKPCPPPPGTAWAKDWEQLAVDAGVSRNASLSTVGADTLDGRLDAHRAVLKPPLPSIIVTHSPEPV